MTGSHKDELPKEIASEIEQLENNLGNLAAEWRMIHRGIEHQAEIVQEYNDTLTKLYQLGWDSLLDVTDELPDEFMPQEYLMRNARWMKKRDQALIRWWTRNRNLDQE